MRFSQKMLDLDAKALEELYEKTKDFPKDTSIEHRIRMLLIHDEWPICQLEGCSEPVKIGKTNGFFICKGCCDEHIKKINNIHSGITQKGKSGNILVSDKREEYIKKLLEKGYEIHSIPLAKEKFNSIKFICSCGNIFNRTVHNALACSPLCKSCADKKRGLETSTTIEEYKERIGLVILTNEAQRQHDYLELICSCGNTFKRRGYSVLAGSTLCDDCYHNTVSKIELELRDFIISLGFEVRWSIRKWSDFKYEIDIFLPEKNIGFELNGLYWHSEIFKDKNYHKDKTDLARAKGIRLVSIFEDEWNFKKELVKNKIKSILKLNKTFIAGRHCLLKEVSTKEEKDFEEQYHIQGYKRSSECFGLYYKDSLVSLMSFFNNKLERYCSSLPIHGGFAKLLKPFNRPIETFCDLRWSSLQDNVYLRNGFVLDHITEPGYFYVKSGKRYSRYKFQKHKLNSLEHFDPSLSESLNMNNNGYYRIWDCGHALYTK